MAGFFRFFSCWASCITIINILLSIVFDLFQVFYIDIDFCFVWGWYDCFTVTIIFVLFQVDMIFFLLKWFLFCFRFVSRWQWFLFCFRSTWVWRRRSSWWRWSFAAMSPFNEDCQTWDFERPKTFIRKVKIRIRIKLKGTFNV